MKGYLHKVGKVWYTTVDLPRLPGAKRRQKEIRLGQCSKAEAHTREREVLGNLDEYCPAESTMTVEDLLKAWLKLNAPTEKAQTIAPKTYERYEAIVRNQLVPNLGRIPLGKLTPRHIAEMQAKLREGGLSGRTCLHCHRVLHTALNAAVKTLRLLKANPASAIAAPKPDSRRIDIREEHVVTLLEATKDTRLGLALVLAALTGLRRGELLGLRWSSVDFERRRLVIAESLEETKQFGLRFKRPKSGRFRVLPLAETLATELKAHKAKQNEDRLRQGQAYSDNDLVLCNEDGTPWPPDTLSKQFAMVANAVGLKGFRLHDVRHAFASISLKQGTSVKEVSELLGHSSPMITLSTYAHTMEGVAREAVNRLADSLLPAGQSNRASVRKCEKTAVAS